MAPVHCGVNERQFREACLELGPWTEEEYSKSVADVLKDRYCWLKN